MATAINSPKVAMRTIKEASVERIEFVSRMPSMPTRMTRSGSCGKASGSAEGIPVFQEGKSEEEEEKRRDEDRKKTA